MSDTVKLIIEIDKRAYKGCKQLRTNDDDGIVAFCAVNTIANGIPLDDVKAEIMSKHFSIVEKNAFDNGRTYGYEECLSILDNIGKAESEE